MAIYSDALPFQFRREKATIRTIRNNGYCWGRIETKSGKLFDVFTKRDWYEYPDEDAIEAFVRASRRTVNVEEVTP